ncbi:MAG TPA: hypothetical protein VHF27_06395 [Acidimicrobiales bacterium]|nr:hypothetical protein [Acidimicrobiales bacterium]
MRRYTLAIAIAALTAFLAAGPAVAQTATTLPGVPAGQGGPDNNINQTQQGGTAPGGRDNPAVDAGPATSTEDDSSIAPWLIGAAALVVLAAGAAFAVRRSTNNSSRRPSYSS